MVPRDPPFCWSLWWRSCRRSHTLATAVFVLSLLLCRALVFADPVPTPSPTGPIPSSSQCPIGTLNRDIYAEAPRETVRTPKKDAWERQQGDRNAQRLALRARLAGWPQALLVPRDSIVQQDFLMRVARDTWRGLVALRDRENGLPLDNVRFGASSVDIQESRIGDYTSTSNIGLFLMGAAAAYEIGLEDRAGALSLVRQVFATLKRLERHEGFFFNYYDTTSLERTSHLLSFVDSSWLVAGLIVTRQTFPELAAEASSWIDRMDFRMFYDPKLRLMSHGYYVDPGRVSPFHYGALYTEARVGVLIAAGKGDVPEDVWYSMARIYPPACDWQSLPPSGVHLQTVRGHSILSGYYEWRGIRFVPSWGGSMFEALMPTLVVDESSLAPQGLGANDLAHVQVQRKYAREELGDPVWGQSPCSTPEGDGYKEYGVPLLGTRGYRAGAVTPHASALALAADPEAAAANLWELTRRYDIYGDFGFYDSVDPKNGAVAHKYMALDQSMILISIANAVKPHCIQQRFAADPIGQRALPLLAGEDFLGASAE